MSILALACLSHHLWQPSINPLSPLGLAVDTAPFHMNAVLLDAIALLAPLLLLFSSSTALVWHISACVAFLQACLIAALYVPVRQAVWEVTETVLVGIGLLLLLPLCAITIFLIAAIAILAVPTLGMAAIMKWSLLIGERCGECCKWFYMLFQLFLYS